MKNILGAVDNGTYTREQFINDSAGYGLAQWTSAGRKQGLYDYAKAKGVSISDVNMQIEFLLAELGVQNAASAYANYQMGGSYHGYNGDSWKNATSVEEAAKAFCWVFERPGNPNMPNRVSKAEEYYNKYKGQSRPQFSGSTVQVGSYTFPHYKQGDYKNVSYGIPGKTIASSGCGPTSLAMILSGLKGDPRIDPASVVANIKAYWPDGSYYVVGAGSSHCIFSNAFLSKYYGVTSVSVSSQKKALEALDNGYPVIRRRRRTYISINASNC